MVKFTIQVIFLVAVLLIGVFLGMDKAEKGIYSIEGVPDTPTQSLEMVKLEDESIQVSVFGQPVTKTVSVAPAEDYVSGLGNKIGVVITDVTRRGIDFVLELIGKII